MWRLKSRKCSQWPGRAVFEAAGERTEGTSTVGEAAGKTVPGPKDCFLSKDQEEDPLSQGMKTIVQTGRWREKRVTATRGVSSEATGSRPCS